jgi:hypothetical protein
MQRIHKTIATLTLMVTVLAGAALVSGWISTAMAATGRFQAV